MTPEQKAAYVNGMAAAALIRAMGMQAENAIRQSRGEALAHDEDAFETLVREHGIDRNSLDGMLYP